MNEQEAKELITQTGAISTGHFVYTSGQHGPFYIDKSLIYIYPDVISLLCLTLAERFAEDNIELVIGPAMGGIFVSHWVAHHLGNLTGRNVASVYAKKSDIIDDFVLNNGFKELIVDCNVLVVEDIITTGNSVKKVIALTRKSQGTVIGLGALWNRGNAVFPDLKFSALVNVVLDSWDKQDCPLCKNGIPVNIELGHGREFVFNKRKK